MQTTFASTSRTCAWAPCRSRRAAPSRTSDPHRPRDAGCAAEPSNASWQPDGARSPAPSWDPEGLFPALPAGGHFARRASKGAASPLDQPVRLDAPTPLRDSLLARPANGSAPIPLAPLAPPPPAAEAASAEEGLGAVIEAAFQDTFWGERRAPRVLESFRRMRRGVQHVQLWPGLGLQRAESFMEGLSAHPFPDVHSGAYPWLAAVERQAAVVQQEFKHVAADEAALAAKGSNVWVPAARKEAVAYGPAWRTLVLQDRGTWDEANIKLFPRTHKLFTDLDAPTLEVFFARQGGGTGIASHTDGANFIQTAHLGLDVPEGQCWMRAGEHTREWRNGGAFVCDTSFMHETHNAADRDRYVLVMRHWHPEVTRLERAAAGFLFACLDDPTAAGVKNAQRTAAKALKRDGGGGGTLKGRKGGKGGSGGGGFGKRQA